MKMEPQEGARLEWIGEQCDLQRMADLMLTEQTRLYKVGYFEHRDAQADSPIGLVADIQAGARRVSNYFMHSFLGCEYAQSPKEVTRRIHELTVEFINQHIDRPEHQAQYGIALLTAMKSNDQSFCPDSFAEHHLEGADRQAYEIFIRDHGVDPAASHPKDTSLIESKLKVTQVGFEGGIRVIGSPDAFRDHVTTQETADGRLELTVIDRIKSVK